MTKDQISIIQKQLNKYFIDRYVEKDQADISIMVDNYCFYSYCSAHEIIIVLKHKNQVDI